MHSCGEDIRLDGLWPLVTQGQLSYLRVIGSPKFFRAGSDPMRGLQDENQEQLLRRSSILWELLTDDVVGVLAAPICSLLSSSLIELALYGGTPDTEVQRFTKEQEEALQLLTSLQELRFWDCKKLQCLPAGLHRLPNHKILKIFGCPAISSLPEDGLPSSLQELYLRSYDDNEKLKQHCRNFVQSHSQIKLVA
uniref:NB-ARC domain-containing protein n=1 Tax=Arundo donax TaxID=35708 RepID=A0A0A9CIW0_ARUDO